MGYMATLAMNLLVWHKMFRTGVAGFLALFTSMTLRYILFFMVLARNKLAQCEHI